MWSDTLLAAERAHLERLLVWSVASLAVGLLMLGVLRYKGIKAPLVGHFAMQTAAWGAIDLALVLWAWRGLRLRDFTAAVGLEHIVWLNVGLDIGYVAVGITLALAGWLLGRRAGAIGAGIGVVTQGLALLVLDGVFLSHIGRLAIHG